MKLFFKIFILIAFYSSSALTKEYNTEYNVKVGGVRIGELFWHLDLNKDNYKMVIKLNDRGAFSGLYKFRGEYIVEGKIKNEKLLPQKYSQLWKTKKKEQKIKIFFENSKISKLILSPEEKELARVKYFDLIDYMDPLSSFLNILVNNTHSKTIDGRRVYTLNPGNNLKKNEISITDYNNIWADHKRNDLKYIEINKNIENSLLPSRIKIKYKNISFQITKN